MNVNPRAGMIKTNVRWVGLVELGPDPSVRPSGHPRNLPGVAMRKSNPTIRIKLQDYRIYPFLARKSTRKSEGICN